MEELYRDEKFTPNQTLCNSLLVPSISFDCNGYTTYVLLCAQKMKTDRLLGILRKTQKCNRDGSVLSWNLYFQQQLLYLRTAAMPGKPSYLLAKSFFDTYFSLAPFP